MGLPGGTVTFLFTDIEGSTRLLQRMGPERYGRLWGAVESEQESRPVPRWDRMRAQYGDRVLAADGASFARGRAEGRLLSIAQALGRDG
jgi:class 3 adenylate cyclase